MRLNIHKPAVSEVKSIGSFHVIELTDLDGYIDLFIDGDWVQWDRIVAAVDKYRSEV